MSKADGLNKYNLTIHYTIFVDNLLIQDND